MTDEPIARTSNPYNERYSKRLTIQLGDLDTIQLALGAVDDYLRWLVDIRGQKHGAVETPMQFVRDARALAYRLRSTSDETRCVVAWQCGSHFCTMIWVAKPPGGKCPTCDYAGTVSEIVAYQLPHTCGICGNPKGPHLSTCAHAQKASERREYHANGTYWSGVPTVDMPCDFCHLAITAHDPRTHACPTVSEGDQR